MYPIDLPAVDDSDLRSSSEQYLSSLESRRHDDEWFQSSQNSKVAITPNNVRWLQVFEDDQSEFSVLVLHPPDHLTQVVALHLHGKWWCVDDVLRTSSKSRSGLVSVQTIMERVIVFLLSQVVERPLQEELLFTLHPRTESCKLLWRDGQAVGFYTIKHKGSLCDSWSSQCYLLPVLDTVLVRRSWRKRGFGLQMLDDFCSSFSREEVLGVSAPLSPSMVAGINEESNPTTLKNEGDDSSEKALLSNKLNLVIQAKEDAPKAARPLEQDVALQPTLMIWTLDLPPDH
ncbi:protein FAM169B [Scomber scombrus]|uniref:Protein FAM169B n=1 Tax=Scomber scombrus TaxID=13677 RepID=A0AAV1PHJ1_SCOSC